jgi:cytochrome bd-type quinol oxidase subunit 1
MVGVFMYLAYQFTEFVVKQDTIYKDIATFMAGYFGTIIAGGVPL